jgi:C4-dicarboxylate-binding protein DctP
MLAPVGKFGPAGVPEFEVFDLPYMFPDLDALQRIYDGPAARVAEEARGEGVLGLAFWNNGFR